MESLNLYQRISEVMKDIEYLAKDDTVGTGKSTYKAITEEKVTMSVRSSLIKNGLVILPIEQHTEEIFTEYEKLNYNKELEKKQRLLTRVDVKYKIVNIDKPAEFEILASSGSGVDTQDKGVGKAMTYSYKYMLLRTFSIPTGEDPDKVSNQELDEESTVTKTKTKEPPKQNTATSITASQLITLAKEKGIAESSLLNKYNVSEIKFMKKEDKKKAYDGLMSMESRK